LFPVSGREHDRTAFPRGFCALAVNEQLGVAITDKIYVKNHRQIASQLETSIPKGAFSGATLDILYQGDGLAKLDDATRDRVLEFAEDFLDCDCEANPHCGHPEEKFVDYLLELRAQGLGPDAIVDVMGDDYMLYAYPGDILSFLDNSVRTLEAVEALADVDENAEMADEARRLRRDLVR
jgi:superfamily II helicase